MTGFKKTVFRILPMLLFLLPPLETFAEDYERLFCTETSRISRPLFPGRENSPEFDYAFRSLPGTDPEAPLVIYLPGGPGGSSISYAGFTDVIIGIPKTYGVVLTDPRGVGCNKRVSDQLTSESHSSEIWAEDIIAILTFLKPKKYILMGHSYGSVLATIVASKIEARGLLPRPMAVVLSGTLGHALVGVGEQYEGFLRGWEAVRKRLSPETLAQLSGKSLPLGVSARVWGRYILGVLTAGGGPAVPEKERLAAKLERLVSPDPAEREKLRADLSEIANRPAIPDGERTGLPIWCQELSAYDNYDMSLIEGRLVGYQNPQYCEGYKLDRVYDSRHWPVSVPLVYFQGEDDPTTVLAQAEYHFLTQTGADRFLVAVPEAGHAALPSLADCRDALWTSIGKGGLELGVALASCRWPTRMKSARGK